MLTPEQQEQYRELGYVIVPSLLSDAEATAFRDRARADLRRESAGMIKKGDADGNVTLLKMWHRADDDFYGRVARDRRLVDIARQLIGRETYLYSHKMTMKEPRSGGAWEWHQDYGYWYQNRCLAPDMLSIWIALDESTQENGCLQILERSHRLGRLDHDRIDGQTVVDMDYLNAATKRFELKYVEMSPGEALVFDCNLLHRSDANTSDNPRWGYIASYNAVDNEPFEHVREYGRYEELVSVAPGAFLDVDPLEV